MDGVNDRGKSVLASVLAIRFSRVGARASVLARNTYLRRAGMGSHDSGFKRPPKLATQYSQTVEINGKWYTQHEKKR